MNNTKRAALVRHVARSLGESTVGSFVLLLVSLTISGVILARTKWYFVEKMSDTYEYQAVSESSLTLRQILSSQRPPLYPIFLSIVRAANTGYHSLWWMQFSVLGLSVIFLYFCCRRSGFRGWESLVLTAPVGSASVVYQYSNMMIPEVFVTAVGIMAFGTTLLIAAKGPSVRRNVLLAAAVFGACITKPAFLFLVLFCPVAIILSAPVFRKESDIGGQGKEFGQVLLWTSVPVASYAFFRWIVVGHFGIVAYGGIALAGLGTNPVMLTAANVNDLPTAEMRGLGKSIISARHVAAAHNTQFENYVYDEDSILKQPMLEGWTAAFDPSIAVALPSARSFYHASQDIVLNPDWILINRKLGELSSTTIRAHKRLYLEWVVRAFRATFQKLFHYQNGGRIAIGLCFMLLILGLLFRGIMASQPNGSVSGLIPVASASLVAIAFVFLLNWEGAASLLRTTVAVLKGTILGSLFPLFVSFACFTGAVKVAWDRSVRHRRLAPASSSMAAAYCALALLYFASGAFLVALVEQPMERYVVTISVLLPGGILLTTINALVSVFSFRRRDA